MIEAETGIKTSPYVGERVAPPVAVVVPGDPYIAGDGDELPAVFGVQVVRLMVLVVGSKGTNKAASEEIDQLVSQLVVAINGHGLTITQVAQPAQVELNGHAFLGSVVEVEQQINLATSVPT